MPWHPPCALSNLIVTKLSSCQRFSLIRFSPETNCKIVAFLRYALTYIIASQLVSLQDVFHLAVQFSKYIRFHISAIPENDTGSRRRTVSRPSCDGFFFISAFRLPHRFLCVSTWNERFSFLPRSLPRKEVIQPHLPIRLPCYDFTPVIGLTFDGWLLSVTSPASGAPNSHGVTGGVYKARERIHRGMLIRDY